MEPRSTRYERHRPEQTTLYRVRGQFHRYTEASTGAELPRFIKNKFDAFLERKALKLSVRRGSSATSWCELQGHETDGPPSSSDTALKALNDYKEGGIR